MKLATFNVNSVRARLPNLLAWLAAAQPDVVMLQEIKTEEPTFPREEIRAAGYHSLVHGQKSYNGVALLTRQPATLVSTSLLLDDPQARYLEATLNGITLINIYAPNGNPVESEKFPYKLRWLEALVARAEVLLKAETPFVIAGDYNIIPTAMDAARPAAWVNDALYQPESRALYRRLLNLGLYDAFRALHPEAAHAYTFWDYQAGAWQRDDGIRIDHALLSPQLADRLISCSIDKAPRGEEKASDHTPLLWELRV